MRRYGLLAVIVAVLVFGTVDIAAAHKKACVGSSKDEISLRMDMRKLWEDHIAWTRLYIISAVNSLPETDKIAARLLKNQEDIGNAIKPFYGNETGNKLTALLKDHIMLAAELVSASKAGETAKAAETEKKWYANGDEIATFLSGANPNWPKATLKEMMDTHLSLTKAVAVAELTKDYEAGIKATDSNHEHILMMADALSSGIVKQFPKKFGKSCCS